jgi:hypothetical protein
LIFLGTFEAFKKSRRRAGVLTEQQGKIKVDTFSRRKGVKGRKSTVKKFAPFFAVQPATGGWPGRGHSTFDTFSSAKSI